MTRAIERCGQISRYGSGDRFSHYYCDDLPAGHSGDHSNHPTRERVTEAWIEALVAAGWVSPSATTPDGPASPLPDAKGQEPA